MLLKALHLLSARNRQGETALFRAARYGKNRMFEFLDGEIIRMFQTEEDCKAFHVAKDTTTILHVSVLTEHYGKYLKTTGILVCLLCLRMRSTR